MENRVLGHLSFIQFLLRAEPQSIGEHGRAEPQSIGERGTKIPDFRARTHAHETLGPTPLR